MVIPKVNFPMHILLAVDGSVHFKACLAMLLDLPWPDRSKITAISAYQADDPGSVQAYSQALEQVKAAFTGRKVEVVTRIEEGDPANLIAETSRQHNCDLIMLGALGLHATLGVMLGGVAQLVVEHTDRPVLVVRAPYLGLRRVILATNGSHNSQQAVELLGYFPLLPECRLTLLNVIPPLPLVDSYLEHHLSTVPPNRAALLKYSIQGEFVTHRAVEEQIGNETLAMARKLLYHFIFGNNRSIRIDTALREGDPAEEIMGYADEAGADMIVTGSRGLHQVQGWLYTSVSRRLVHYSPCSVLIVRGLPTYLPAIAN